MSRGILVSLQRTAGSSAEIRNSNFTFQVRARWLRRRVPMTRQHEHRCRSATLKRTLPCISTSLSKGSQSPIVSRIGIREGGKGKEGETKKKKKKGKKKKKKKKETYFRSPLHLSSQILTPLLKMCNWVNSAPNQKFVPGGMRGGR